MTTVLDLLLADDEPDRPAHTPRTGPIPVGYRARMFIEHGAPVGEQRTEAVRATRNLLEAGYGVEDTGELIWRGLQASDNDPARPWTYADALDMARDLASKPAPPPKSYDVGRIEIDHLPVPAAGASEFSKDGDVFRLTFPAEDVVIEVSRVVATARATVGWVRVLLGGEELCAVEAELKGAQGVLQAWRFFESWGPLPWREMLERARRVVLAERRVAGVPVRMDEVVLTERPRLRVAPLIVNGHLNIVFAAGGSGKSMFLGLLALLVQGGRAHAGLSVEPGNVLYLDWEQDAEDSKRTLDALTAGMGEGATVRHLYVRCAGPLVEIAEDMGRLIVEHEVDVVMIDSLTFALGGDKNDAQNVLAAFAAMRVWPEGVTVVALDHVNKADRHTAGGTTIGSVMVENTARNLLRVIAWQDPETHVLHQVLRQTKQNKGRIDDFGLRYTFHPASMDPEIIFVEREDPPFDVEGKLAEKVDKVARGPQRARVLAHIKEHPDRLWSKSGLALALDISEDTVKSALGWLLNGGLIYQEKGAGRTPHVYGHRGLAGG